MKFSLKYIIVIAISLVMVVILLFTQIGAIGRRSVGVFLSEITVALKEDKQLSLDAFKWQLIDLKGNLLTFGEKKGRVVFLNFWASWCKPCLKEMPDIQKLYSDYGSQVDFLLVTQEDSLKVKTFLKKRNYDLPFYFSDGDIPEVLYSKTLPTTYIIDRKEKIVLAESGAMNWNSLHIRVLLDNILTDTEQVRENIDN